MISNRALMRFSFALLAASALSGCQKTARTATTNVAKSGEQPAVTGDAQAQADAGVIEVDDLEAVTISPGEIQLGIRYTRTSSSTEQELADTSARIEQRGPHRNVVVHSQESDIN